MRSSNSYVATRLDTELISYLRVYFASQSTHNMCKSLHIFNENARVSSFPRRMEDFSVQHIVPRVDIGYFLPH